MNHRQNSAISAIPWSGKRTRKRLFLLICISVFSALINTAIGFSVDDEKTYLPIVLVNYPANPLARAIAFVQEGNIWTVQPDGSNLVQVTMAGNYIEPEWSPTRQEIAFIHTYQDATSQQSAWEILVIDLTSGQTRTVVPAELTPFVLLGNYYQYSNPRWAPDGNTLYYIASDGRVQGDFVHKMDLLTQQKDVNFTPFNARAISVSPVDGCIAFTEYFNGIPAGYTLSLAAPDGTGRQVILPLEDEVGIFAPDFAPDGERLAVLRNSWIQGYSHIEVMRLDSSDRVIYSVEISPVPHRLSWSSSSEWVVYEVDGFLRILDLVIGTTIDFIPGQDPSW